MSNETVNQKNARGRPIRVPYTDEMADRICRYVGTHTESTRKILEKHDDVPGITLVNQWRFDHESFAIKYAEAKRKQADLLAEEVVELADNIPSHEDKDGITRIDTGIMMQRRLAVDARRWIASKLIPKVYGSTKELHEERGKNAQLQRELAELRAELNLKHKKEY